MSGLALTPEDRARQQKILHLVDMGFSFVHAQNALISAGFDSDRAIAILTSPAPPPKPAATGIPLESDDLYGMGLFESGERRPLLARGPPPGPPRPTPHQQQQQQHQNPQWGRMYEEQRKEQQMQPYVRMSLFTNSTDPASGKRQLLFNIKLFVAVAVVVGFIVTFFASFWVMWVYLNWPECGTSLKSARFSVYSSSTYRTKDSGVNDDTYSSWYRILSGNSCPGYDWTSQGTPATAGDDEFETPLPLIPVNCTTPTLVGIDDPVFGHIGYALNGIAIFSPSDGSSRDAVEYEHDSFDQCGGHVKAQSLLINKIFLSSEPPGTYHYHSMPGDSDPYGHSSDVNTDFALCDDVSSWYVEADGAHSPIAGFMLDGIPIYGPQGVGGLPPSDLDQCGGHNSDLPFYHYHFKSVYPYSVDCLWGRTDGMGNEFLNNYDSCEVSPTQSDYSTLTTYSTEYGGEGVNYRNTFGCLFLISFGGLILVYGIGHYAVIAFYEWWEGRKRPIPPPPQQSC